MSADEERIALFLDYENLAIGARENLGGMAFDFKPVADALADRGRVVVRRAYADWLKFGEDGRMLTRFHVELIEIPQRMGSVRKNAADIKMAVDAVELCLERDYITTFVLGTGDSDFTPLVHKLREHNKQVIGLGVQMSTSALLPPACDEFLFYERLEGVEVPKRRIIVPRGSGGRRRRPQVGDVGELGELSDTSDASDASDTGAEAGAEGPTTIEQVERLITQTLSGLERTSGAVRASSLKRAILRKESTFNEADHGFRGFTELLRSLSERGVIELAESSSAGDPDVLFPSDNSLGEVGHAFELLADTVERLAPAGSSGTPLSGLKTQLRRVETEFSEKRFGFGGFLQFAKAAVARGLIAMEWNDDADDYLLTVVAGRPKVAPRPVASDPEPAATANTVTTAAGPQSSDTEAALDAGLAARPRRGRGGRGRGRGGRAELGESDDASTSLDPAGLDSAPLTSNEDLAPIHQGVAPETSAAEPTQRTTARQAQIVRTPPAELTPSEPPEQASPAAEATPRKRRAPTRKAATAADHSDPVPLPATDPVVAAADLGADTTPQSDAAPRKPAARRRRSTKADEAATPTAPPAS